MRKISALAFLFILAGCSTKEKHNFNRYYGIKEQDEILTSIIAFIFTPPPYTKKEDRFKPQHRAFYSGLTPRFKILRYYVSSDGTHYFYLSRPSSVASELRGVAGHFKMNKNYALSEFKEEFVTTVMTETELEKSSFLFDAMVKGDLKKFIGMKAYIQWPNEISRYDTVKYEWVLKPGADL